MRRAIELAKQGGGFTSPNPCVGAVIVKAGTIVAEGWHRKAGDDHAEIVAIKEIMKKSGIVTVDLDPNLFHNASLYVTLEPCFHTGKTPPCVKALAAAKFNKIYVGMKDPFKKVNGKGIKYLKQKGLEVEVCRSGSKLVAEIRDLNQAFIKWAETGMPYVILKAGMSLDGKVATGTGESKWITSEAAREDAKLERSTCDAVLVGSGTVKSDNPELAAIGRYRGKNLLRVVVSSKLNLDLKAKVFRDENVFVACSDAASTASKQKFKNAGIGFKSFGKEKVNIKKLLLFLAKRSIQSVFVEGGSNIHGLFFDETLKDKSLVDKILFYIAPKLIGGSKSLPVIAGGGIEKLSKAISFKDWKWEGVGENLKVTGVINLY